MKGKFILGMPFIELEVNGVRLSALLDTGFNGWLSMPAKLIEKLNLEESGTTDYVPATGKRHSAKTYRAKLKMFGEEKIAAVLAGQMGFTVVGLEVLHDYKITIARSKELVEVEKS